MHDAKTSTCSLVVGKLKQKCEIQVWIKKHLGTAVCSTLQLQLGEKKTQREREGAHTQTHTSLTGVVVVSIYVVQIVDGSVLGLRTQREERRKLKHLNYRGRKFWITQNRLIIIDRKTKSFVLLQYLPQSCVSVCCLSQGEAWREGGQSALKLGVSESLCQSLVMQPINPDAHVSDEAELTSLIMSRCF